VQETNILYVLSRTVSRFIGQIFAADRDEGCLSSTHSFMWNPKFRIAKFGNKKAKIPFYAMLRSMFQYLEPCRRDSRVWQIDGRTNTRVANVAPNYLARPKKRLLVNAFYETNEALVKVDTNFAVLNSWGCPQHVQITE